MKILDSKNKNFDKILNKILFQRKKKIQSNQEMTLGLIGIDYLKNKDDYEINLIFDNNSHIALTTETIEVRLEDQNEIKD